MYAPAVRFEIQLLVSVPRLFVVPLTVVIRVPLLLRSCTVTLALLSTASFEPDAPLALESLRITTEMRASFLLAFTRVSAVMSQTYMSEVLPDGLTTKVTGFEVMPLAITER